MSPSIQPAIISSLKVTPLHDVTGTAGKQTYTPTHACPRLLMGVVGQRHAPARSERV
jgi:hypothetical protein